MLADFPKPVTAAAAKAAGVQLLRYWPKQGGSTIVVGLSRAECADLNAGGVPFSTIYEGLSASWMSGGAAAGVAAGNWLRQQFAAAAYTPRCVYLAADSNTLATSSVNACLDGAASVLGRDTVGLYAYLPQLQAAQAGNHASRYWLTGHYVTPSAYPWINVYQCQGSQPAQYPTTVNVAGQTGDGDIAFASDWGQSGEVVTDPVSVWTVTIPSWHPADAGDVPNFQPGAHLEEIWERIQWLLADAENKTTGLAAISAQIAALQGAMTSEQAAVLAAVQGISAGQVDMNALAAALVPVLSAADAQQFIANLGALFPKPQGV